MASRNHLFQWPVPGLVLAVSGSELLRGLWGCKLHDPRGLDSLFRSLSGDARQAPVRDKAAVIGNALLLFRYIFRGYLPGDGPEHRF